MPLEISSTENGSTSKAASPATSGISHIRGEHGYSATHRFKERNAESFEGGYIRQCQSRRGDPEEISPATRPVKCTSLPVPHVLQACFHFRCPPPFRAGEYQTDIRPAIRAELFVGVEQVDDILALMNGADEQKIRFPPVQLVPCFPVSDSCSGTNPSFTPLYTTSILSVDIPYCRLISSREKEETVAMRAAALA